MKELSLELYDLLLDRVKAKHEGEVLSKKEIEKLIEKELKLYNKEQREAAALKVKGRKQQLKNIDNLKEALHSLYPNIPNKSLLLKELIESDNFDTDLVAINQKAVEIGVAIENEKSEKDSSKELIKNLNKNSSMEDIVKAIKYLAKE